MFLINLKRLLSPKMKTFDCRFTITYHNVYDFQSNFKIIVKNCSNVTINLCYINI